MKDMEKENVPASIIVEYNDLKKEYKHASIVYNTESKKHLVCIIPLNWAKNKNLQKVL